jgi:NADPH:quinone reductase-like Zn-dependent oxidoreductase
VAAESEALMDLRATALNFGEVHFIDHMRKPGEVPGWDAAGVVVQAAADGSGPPVGSRVVGSAARGTSLVELGAAEALLDRRVAGKAVWIWTDG